MKKSRNKNNFLELAGSVKYFNKKIKENKNAKKAKAMGTVTLP